MILFTISIELVDISSRPSALLILSALIILRTSSSVKLKVKKHGDKHMQH